MQASPQLFPALQFSPDLFQPQMSGPTTAPVFPQQRLFWDPSSTDGQGPGVSAHYQDTFSAAQNQLVSPFTPSPVLSHGFQNVATVPDPHSYDLPAQEPHVMTASGSPYVESAVFPAPFTASPRMPPPLAEDPSMFLSSPARRFGPAAQPSNHFGVQSLGGRQPYHHQIEESRREEEFERSKKAKIQHPSNSTHSINFYRHPVSPNPEGRPGLKRSLTHSGIGDRVPHLRQQSQVSFAESVSVVDGEPRQLSRGGRSSPLKRNSHMSFRASSERPQSKQRTSLTFTIDEDGRAKTLITNVPEPVDSRMQVDEESSESDTDSVDGTDFDVVRSQNASFAFPDQEEQQNSSAKAIFDSRSHLKTHSKNSSYSSTLTSSNSAYHSSGTSSIFGSTRLRPDRSEAAHARHGQSYSNQPRTGLPKPGHLHKDLSDGEDSPDFEDKRGDAQHALRAIMKERPRSMSSQHGNVSKRRSGLPPQFHSSPPNHDNTFGVFNASPTTITDPDLATPSTDRESFASSGSTRCVCNSAFPDGRLMIQW